MIDVSASWEGLVERWPSRSGLILALIFSSVFCYVLLAPVLGGHYIWLLPACWAIVFSAWSYCRSVPKFRDDVVGILIAIDCEDSAARKRFGSDFVRALKIQFSQGRSGGQFQVKEVPRGVDLVVDTHSEATSLREKSRATLLLYGRVRTTNERGVRFHLLELHGALGVPATSEKNKGLLAREFQGLLFNSLKFRGELELRGFSLGSQLVEPVVRYLVGCVKLTINQFDEAKKLILDARDLTAGLSLEIPVVRQLQKLCELRLSNIELNHAAAHFERWKISRDPALLGDIMSCLARFKSASPNPMAASLKAIASYGLNGTVEEAAAILLKAGASDPVVCISLAFLDAQKGDLKSAERYYKKAIDGGVDAEIVAEVWDFIDWAAQCWGKSAECHFCQGIIALRFYCDKELASQCFQSFVSLRGGRYNREVELIPKWISGNDAPKERQVGESKREIGAHSGCEGISGSQRRKRKQAQRSKRRRKG